MNFKPKLIDVSSVKIVQEGIETINKALMLTHEEWYANLSSFLSVDGDDEKTAFVNSYQDFLVNKQLIYHYLNEGNICAALDRALLMLGNVYMYKEPGRQGYYGPRVFSFQYVED